MRHFLSCQKGHSTYRPFRQWRADRKWSGWCGQHEEKEPWTCWVPRKHKESVPAWARQLSGLPWSRNRGGYGISHHRRSRLTSHCGDWSCRPDIESASQLNNLSRIHHCRHVLHSWNVLWGAAVLSVSVIILSIQIVMQRQPLHQPKTMSVRSVEMLEIRYS